MGQALQGVRSSLLAGAAKQESTFTLRMETEAVDLVKSLAAAKFDESVELAVRLGVDPRKADQIVRGTVSLPGGTGQDVRVAVFAAGLGIRRPSSQSSPASPSAPPTCSARRRIPGAACATWPRSSAAG